MKYNAKTTKLYIYENGSPIKVVIRSRGSAHLICIWNTDTNEFTIGQWLCGKKLMPHRCCYKNDGDFIYEYKQFGCDTRIVRSTPPYFTAHEMWETNCITSPVKIVSTNEQYLQRTPYRYFTTPVTIIGSQLNAANGDIIHDFSNDRFVHVAPPDDYVIGNRIHENVLLTH
jgi:hypothetical protein